MINQIQARAWLGSALSFALISASFALDAGATSRHFSSNLPLLHLKTSKGAEIGKEAIPTQITLLDEAVNNSRDLFSRAPSFNGEVELRGYSSAKFRKQQFDLELKDPQDKEKDLKAPLLGMPAHHKWVLSSQYMDRSLIRNPLAYAIASEMPLAEGKTYAPRSRPIELFINGQYQGVYYLGEKIDISKSRLNISKPDFSRAPESTFMVKVEKKRSLLPDEFFYTWGKENKAAFYEPKAKKIREMMQKNPEQAKQMVSHIRSKFREFEFALMAIEQGDRHSYRSLLELESFQNFILVQEVRSIQSINTWT